VTFLKHRLRVARAMSHIPTDAECGANPKHSITAGPDFAARGPQNYLPEINAEGSNLDGTTWGSHGGLQRRVDCEKFTGVSKARTAFIIRVMSHSSPWWRRQQVPLKRRWTYSSLHGSATQKTAIFVTLIHPYWSEKLKLKDRRFTPGFRTLDLVDANRDHLLSQL
jgi:hypothetical protein